MGFHPNGGHGHAPAEERLNVFALVIYVPEPLCRFLDSMRRELVPHSEPHAHVSVLPPRPLAVPWQEASAQARAILEDWAPFDVELAGITTFRVTDVVYLDLAGGATELHALHCAMNSGALAFDEPFPYCPHVTLAQEIPHADVAAAIELARRRWSEYRGPRFFRAERAVFVQNLLSEKWLDLAEYSLGAVPAR
jgi:2'-5' RNA ligase